MVGKFVLIVSFLLCCATSFCCADKDKKLKEKEKWKKKDVTDYNDADLEQLYEQWDENSPDDVEEGDLPEHKRTPPSFDPTKKVDSSFLGSAMKGKTLLLFATVSGNPTKQEADDISFYWQTCLHNMHIPTQRFMVSDTRTMFQLSDGSKAFEVKDFLVEQDRCALVTFEGTNYPGKGAFKRAKEASGSGQMKKKKTEL